MAYACNNAFAEQATPSTYASGNSEMDRTRRTMSKRLATIFEEHCIEYEEPQSDAELEERRQEAVELRSTDVEGFAMLRKARNVNLCFVLDATGSMGPHIVKVRGYWVDYRRSQTVAEFQQTCRQCSLFNSTCVRSISGSL